MESEKIKILIADAHPIVHQGLTNVLNPEPDFQIVGYAHNAPEAIAHSRHMDPHVVLLAYSLPGGGGLSVINRLKKEKPDVACLVFTMHNKESYIQQALQAGAQGYLLKDDPISEIPVAVRSAVAGTLWLSTRIQESILKVFLEKCRRSQPILAYDLLTESEKKIFLLTVEGFSTAGIAEEIHLSPKTVEKHRSSILKKLGARNLFGLIKYAIEIGILDPDSWRR